MSHRFAADIRDLDLAEYQRTVRLLLRHPLVTADYPNPRVLPRVRRFARTLAADLADAFGYRLELHGDTARLARVHDRLNADRPALTATKRVFDRRRYAYLTLALAALGRPASQITVGELAELVAADANRIAALGLDPDSGADRRAFVDAVGWLAERGVLRLADGSADRWASGSGEALYDVARDVVFALFRPARPVQHLDSVTDLLDRAHQHSGNGERRAAGQYARRAVVERPVVYFADVPAGVLGHLRGSTLPADLHRLTGLPVERRAEGLVLVDTAGLSMERFPGSGSVAQVAALLLTEIGDRVTDPDGRRVRRLRPPLPATAQAELAAAVDAGRPSATAVPWWEPDDDPDEGATDPDSVGDDADPAALPFVTDAYLRESVALILDRFGAAFKAAWRADPDGLLAEAVGLLTRFDLVTVVAGGLLVHPLAGRYRNTVAMLRERPAALF